MLGKYDQVLGELKKMEMRNAPLSAEMAKKQAGGSDVPSFGPADAKVTIVEYSDFECPYCARAAKIVSQLKKAYPEGVRFVFRQYPLPMHKNAQVAAEASLAAHAQGKFWAMHDKLFENSRNLSRETVDKIAQEIGLNMEKFKAALDNHTYADAVKADMDLGGEIGVTGTPTMIVNTKRVKNPGDFAGLTKLIEEEGGPKAKEVKGEEKKEEKKGKVEVVQPPGGAPKAPKAPAPAAPAAPKAPAPATP
jgi:protein-disulfide isomerase